MLSILKLEDKLCNFILIISQIFNIWSTRWIFHGLLQLSISSSFRFAVQNRCLSEERKILVNSFNSVKFNLSSFIQECTGFICCSIHIPLYFRDVQSGVAPVPSIDRSHVALSAYLQCFSSTFQLFLCFGGSDNFWADGRLLILMR